MEIEQVPQIFAWIEQVLAGSGQINAYPLFFEQSRLVCRLYQVFFATESSYMLTSEQERDRFEDVLAEGVGDQPMRMILLDKHSPLFAALQRSDPTTNLQDYLMLKRSSNFADLHSFEKVLYTLKEEQLGFDELQLWPDMVSLLFYEIIRYTRLNL